MDPISLGLPHRSPFVFVDSVDELEAGQSARCSKTFHRSEAFFEGHLPGNEIVPDVRIIVGMSKTAGIAVCGPRKMFLLAAIPTMKLLREDLPEQSVSFSARK